MKSIISRHLLVFSLLLPLAATPQLVAAQTPVATPPAADTTHKYENPSGVPTANRKPFFKSKGFRAAVVPAVVGPAWV